MRKISPKLLSMAGICLLAMASAGMNAFGQELPEPPAPLPGLDDAFANEPALSVTAPAVESAPVAAASTPVAASGPIAPEPPKQTPKPISAAGMPAGVQQPMVARPMYQPGYAPAPVAAQGVPCRECQTCPPGYTGWGLPMFKPYRAQEFEPYQPNPCAAGRCLPNGIITGPMMPAGSQYNGQYPYYTTRGPRDFYLKDPRAIGP